MIIYTVKRGDTMWKLSRRYRVGLEALLKANPEINDPNYISIGQQINIPVDSADQPSDAICSCSDDPWARPCIYTAQEGETLTQISESFMIPLSLLLYHNRSYGRQEQLPQGCRIIIPDPGISPLDHDHHGKTHRQAPQQRPMASPPGGQRMSHTVNIGQNASPDGMIRRPPQK